MKSKLLILLFVLCSECTFACACVPLWTDQEVFDKTELIFIGTVIKIDTVKTVPDFFVKEHDKKKDSTYSYSYDQLVTFKVKRVVKGHWRMDTIVIITGMGGSDCGYTFRKSKGYIVHTNQIASHLLDETTSREKLVTRSFFQTDVCDRTTGEIKKELKFLRKFLRRHKN